MSSQESPARITEVGSTVRTGRPTVKTGVFEYILYYMGKPFEEWPARLIGQITTDDPKYRIPSTSLYDRIGFEHLYESAGVSTGLALALGIGTAVANPFDLFNKLPVGALTKVGKLSAAKSITKIEKGARVLSKFKPSETIAKLVETGMSAKKARKVVTKQVRQRRELSRLIHGVNMDAVEDLGTSLFDRVRKGQAAFIGFDPGGDILSRALGFKSRGYQLPLVDKGLGQVMRPVEFSASKLKTGFVTLLAKLGLDVSPHPVGQQIIAIARSTLSKHPSIGVKEGADFITSLQEMGIGHFTPDQMRAVIDALEVPNDMLGIKRQLVDVLTTSGDKVARELETATLKTFPTGLGIERKTLTEYQKKWLKPKGLSDTETDIVLSDMLEGKMFVSDASGKAKYASNREAVAMHLPLDTAPALPKAVKLLDKIDVPGIAPFSVRAEGDGIAIVTRNLIEHASNDLTELHLDTLQKMGAMLSRHNMSLSGITPSDLRLGTDGSVQLINPLRVVKGGKTKNAILTRTRNSILALADEAGLPKIKYPFLTVKRARSVKPEHFRFLDIGLSHTGIAGSEKILPLEIGFFDEFRNLRQFDDMAPEEQALVRQYQELIKARRQLPVIHFGTDDLMQRSLYGAHDNARILAAKLEGVERLAARNLGYLGDVPKSVIEGAEAAGGLAGTASRSLKPVEALSGLRSAYAGVPEAHEFVRGLRIIDDEAGSIAASQRRYAEATETGLESKLTTWYSRAASGDPVISHSPEWIGARGAQIRQAGLTSPVKVAKLLEQHTDMGSFMQALGLSDSAKLSINDARAMAGEFTVLKTQAATMLDNLEDAGFFVPGRTSIVERIDEWTKTGRTVLVPSEDGLHVINTSKTREALHAWAKSFVTEGAPDLSVGAKIQLRGSDGALSTTKGALLGEAKWARASLSVPTDQVFYRSPAHKARLKEAGIEFLSDYDPGKAWASLAKSIETKPDPMPFIIPASGSDIIIGTKHENLPHLLDDVFGELPRHALEVGSIHLKSIHISNVLGTVGLEELTHRALMPLESRLRKIARMFKDAGFGTDIPLVVHTPWGDLWKGMYGTKAMQSGRKLGEVASDDFKLLIPEGEQFRDMALYDENILTDVMPRSERVADPQVRKVIDFIENYNDVTFIREIKARLPVEYYEGYFPRILSPELMKLLQDMDMEYRKTGGSAAKRWLQYWKADQFKGRTVTDMTTVQFNDLFKAAKEKAGTLTPEDWQAFLEYGRNADHSFMKELAIHDSEAYEFFTENVFRASFQRRVAAEKAINVKKAYDEIMELAAINPGGSTRREMQDIINFGTRKAEAEAAIDAAKAALASAEEAGQEAAIKLAQADLDKAAKRFMDLDSLRKTLRVSPVGDELRSGTWVISMDDAKDLIKKNVFTIDDFADQDLSRPFALLPTDKFIEKSVEGVKAYILPSERMADLNRFFKWNGATSNQFLKYWDTGTNLWKSITLFALPSFVAYNNRNLESNMMLAFIGGIGLASFGKSVGIFNRIRAYGRLRKGLPQHLAELRKLVINTPNGIMNGEEIWNGFVRNGGKSSFVYSEWGLDSNVDKALQRMGMLRSSDSIATNFLLENKLFSFGKNLSAANEEFFRLTAYIDELVRSGSHEAASLNMKKIFYDYNDLTGWEKKILRRAVPFYSWLRFNTPRMIETLFTRPVAHFRIQQSVERIQQSAGGPASEEELPEFLTRMLPVVVGRRDGKTVMITQDATFPVADAVRLLDPEALMWTTIGAVHPLPKLAAEFATGTSLFSGEKIRKAPGQPARSYTLASLGGSRVAEHLLSQVRPVKQTLEFIDNIILGRANISGQQLAPIEAMINFGLTRVYANDPDLGRWYTNLRKKELLGVARSWERFGVRFKHPHYIEAARKMRLNILLTAEDN